MTDITFTGSHGVVAVALRHIAEGVLQCKDSLRAAIRAHDAYENYSMMSDAALAEIGLTREEIPARIMNRYLSNGS